MASLIAIHEIIRTGKDGKREAIAPGKPFEATGKEVDFFLNAGAAKRDPGANPVADTSDTDAIKGKDSKKGKDSSKGKSVDSDDDTVI